MFEKRKAGVSMKKFFFLFMILMVVAACSSNKNTQEEMTPIQNQEENIKEEANEVFSGSLFDTQLSVQQSEQKLLFDIQLINQTKDRHELTFNSGQKFEIVVNDTNGNELYRFSQGKMFTQALETMTIAGNEKRSWQNEWSFPENLKDKQLTVKAELKVHMINGKVIKDKNDFKAEQLVQINEPNTAFRNVKVAGSKGTYTVTGEARVFEGVFYYAVEDGHEYVIEETKVEVEKGAPEWSSFEIEINIPKDQLPESGTLSIEMYELSPKDGMPANIYYTQLEQIK